MWEGNLKKKGMITQNSGYWLGGAGEGCGTQKIIWGFKDLTTVLFIKPDDIYVHLIFFVVGICYVVYWTYEIVLNR